MKIIYGISDLAEKLYFMLRESSIKIDAFTVNQKYMTKSEINHIPVLPYEGIRKDVKEKEIYLAVGYRNMNRNRERIYYEVKNDGFQVLSFIHHTASVSTEILGEGTLIFEGVVIGPYAKLGNGNICYPGSLIAHHTIIGDFNFFAISSSVAGNVVVGDRCFFGNNSCTKDGIKISNETLVGAGTYISSSTEFGESIVPARSVALNKKSIELL